MQLPAHTDVCDANLRTEAPAFALVAEQLAQVKDHISQQLSVPENAGEVSRLVQHVDKRSGKMIRPGLVLLAGLCCGKLTDLHIRVAAVVEMIHNATLLHDDVIDDGKKRRGLPTVNSVWGNESAVLLGDFLLSRVFRMCAELPARTAKLIATTAVRVCEGELRQVAHRRDWNLTEADYIDIITEKSASLFSSCCYLGAVLARAGRRHAHALAAFGLNVGVAFQITDDVLDLVGDESVTGKTLGSDVDKNKLTLPFIHLLRTVDADRRNQIQDMLSASNPDAGDLLKMLRKAGSMDYARSQARAYVDRAIAAVNGFKAGRAKDALVEIAGFIAGRAV